MINRACENLREEFPKNQRHLHSSEDICIVMHASNGILVSNLCIFWQIHRFRFPYRIARVRSAASKYTLLVMYTEELNLREKRIQVEALIPTHELSLHEGPWPELGIQPSRDSSQMETFRRK